MGEVFDWFTDDVLTDRKKRPVTPPVPRLERGDGVELAIALERDLGLTDGAAVVKSREICRRVGDAWQVVPGYELARLLMPYAGRETPTGPLRITPALVSETIGLLRQRWPVVAHLPILSDVKVEPDHG